MSSVYRYGPAHRRLRRIVARSVAAGSATCARCHQPIRPDEKWDLGHDDRDRSRYSGPEHQSCNRRTLAHAREAAGPRASRVW